MGSVRLILIPAGSRIRRCTSCGRLMYDVPTKNGGTQPVRVIAGREGHAHPSKVAAGAGESHFADCPNADHHRRAGRARVGA